MKKDENRTNPQERMTAWVIDQVAFRMTNGKNPNSRCGEGLTLGDTFDEVLSTQPSVTKDRVTRGR